MNQQTLFSVDKETLKGIAQTILQMRNNARSLSVTAESLKALSNNSDMTIELTNTISDSKGIDQYLSWIYDRIAPEAFTK